MQRETVYTLDVENPRKLTKKEAEEMDKCQPWRKRISSGALDDLNALKTILLWADSIVGGPQFRELLRDMDSYKYARAGVGLLTKAVETMFSNISAVQLRVMDANWQTMNVTLSASRIVPGFVNVDVDTIDTLINQALVSCKEGFCMAGGRESAKCPVRSALDACINAGRAIEKAGACGGLDHCPYALNRAESRCAG